MNSKIEYGLLQACCAGTPTIAGPSMDPTLGFLYKLVKLCAA